MKADVSPAGAGGMCADSVEFIRIWYKDIAEWEAQGWELDYAKATTHSDLMGESHLDCLMVRMVPSTDSASKTPCGAASSPGSSRRR